MLCCSAVASGTEQRHRPAGCLPCGPVVGVHAGRGAKRQCLRGRRIAGCEAEVGGQKAAIHKRQLVAESGSLSAGLLCCSAAITARAGLHCRCTQTNATNWVHRDPMRITACCLAARGRYAFVRTQKPRARRSCGLRPRLLRFPSAPSASRRAFSARAKSNRLRSIACGPT